MTFEINEKIKIRDPGFFFLDRGVGHFAQCSSFPAGVELNFVVACERWSLTRGFGYND